MKIRNNLFKLRDELRAYHASGDVVDSETFEIIHGGINNFINRVSSLNFAAQRKLKSRYKHDQKFKEELQNLSKKIDDSPDKELKRIDDEATKWIAKAFIVNHGAWLVYVVPVVFVILTFSSVKKLAQRLFLVPKQQINSIAPSRKLAI
ncbi:hypothetical protein [Glaciecola sp. SC05]|uniref:hypothetical protein n=1 Tax=Glaciecola sp. SC05 TaxID=1987355 RepID=UPI003526DA1C